MNAVLSPLETMRACVNEHMRLKVWNLTTADVWDRDYGIEVHLVFVIGNRRVGLWRSYTRDKVTDSDAALTLLSGQYQDLMARVRVALAEALG